MLELYIYIDTHIHTTYIRTYEIYKILSAPDKKKVWHPFLSNAPFQRRGAGWKPGNFSYDGGKLRPESGRSEDDQADDNGGGCQFRKSTQSRTCQ